MRMEKTLKFVGRLLACAALIPIAASGAQAQSTAPGMRPVSIHFGATVGDASFACGAKFDGIGTTQSSITVSDFRFYVSNVRLVTESGVEVPLMLTQDGLWQQDDVALLDFEDGTKSCANGTPELRDVIEGTAPEGRYTGVRFVLGLPFEKNHRDPTLQPSPLNLSRMFWNWNGGYKFLRVDLRSTGQPQGWFVHLGSTACTPREGPTTVPVSCKNPNTVSVDLSAFDATRDVVRFDLATLLANSNVDAMVAETGAGCMSGGADPECAPLFEEFGLPFGDAVATVQRVFSVVSPKTLSQGAQQ